MCDRIEAETNSSLGACGSNSRSRKVAIEVDWYPFFYRYMSTQHIEEGRVGRFWFGWAKGSHSPTLITHLYLYLSYYFLYYVIYNV